MSRRRSHVRFIGRERAGRLPHGQPNLAAREEQTAERVESRASTAPREHKAQRARRRQRQQRQQHPPAPSLSFPPGTAAALLPVVAELQGRLQVTAARRP